MSFYNKHLARKFALQALYQWTLSGANLNAVAEQYVTSKHFKKADKEYFHTLFLGIAKSVGELDALLTPLLDRPVEQLDPIEHNVLRLGTFELLNHPEVPYKVVINEAVELTKVFGATDGHKFVNGILDKLAPQLRGVECD